MSRLRIALLTGAGMSAESGVPTSRDALTGLWSRFDATRLATLDAFRADPALVWGWYRSRALGKPVLEINPLPSALTPEVDEHWKMSASTGLQRLLRDVAGS